MSDSYWKIAKRMLNKASQIEQIDKMTRPCVAPSPHPGPLAESWISSLIQILDLAGRAVDLAKRK